MTDINSKEDEKRFLNIYRECLEEVASLLPADMAGVAKHNPGWTSERFDVKDYLKRSETRYIRALRAIRAAGAKSVLDVGGFLAAFPLALSRIGYTVAIAEKFGYYDHALDGIAHHLSKNGVQVIDADFTEEKLGLEGPPPLFDAVTCMAVAEHLAHTPRFLLANIASALRPGGALVFEVPNLAFWPRRASFFLKGTTVHSPIADVFHSAIPFTGHHREYTLSDMRYVLAKSGFEIVSEETFNYSIDTSSLLQVLKNFPAFIVKDCAELILASGRKRG
ncbi:MAG: methyltransferase domain-containing protein [Ramlibacter sp.]|jgi:2-polyprenyl-3-methyl-5-hydroxy-6-metoxy-1,4-benzoquinol methylase|uniref:class I SAM-dependent methyltransferase n=1 Tax=Ramlibacter sp. TaxID=1917967 RepID=UPI00261FC0F7|nr:methyltransferase domain-containing protein [Ramlibacter sp.]MDH4377719.1 methyltransferase domain-containing protein [Ramlibacter sp.]